MPTMPGALPLSPIMPRSPPVIEAIVTKEPLVVPVSEDESPYVTPARTPVFPQVPTEAPRAPSVNEVERMLAYAQDAIAHADEADHRVEEPAPVAQEPEEMKAEEIRRSKAPPALPLARAHPAFKHA